MKKGLADVDEHIKKLRGGQVRILFSGLPQKLKKITPYFQLGDEMVRQAFSVVTKKDGKVWVLKTI